MSSDLARDDDSVAAADANDGDIENVDDVEVDVDVQGPSSNGAGVNNSGVENRVRRKAKRPSQYINNPNKESATTATGNGNSRLLKNSRKPRNGFGRGLPKKGGAGGKGTWGVPGCEIMADAELDNDAGDPNYDSDAQDNYVLETILPQLTEEEISKYLEPLLLEYFEHGDTNEVAVSLQELNFGVRKFQIVSMAVSLAMEHKPSHREMTSVLISDLYSQVLCVEDVGRGFDALLKDLPDMVLDTPEAPVILGNFIARAVADDCIPPKFPLEYKKHLECQFARAAIERAVTILNMKHGLVKLDNVWGVGGGIRPVKYLIKKMMLLLKEYLSSGDVTEAAKCLQDLEVPHFNHELVYEAIVMTVEDMRDRTADLICKLLKSLYSSTVVTYDQLKRGFERAFEDMPDISIDVPQAYNILEKFVTKCQESGVVNDDILRKLPSRGRKRFVSEGDGGRVKADTAA